MRVADLAGAAPMMDCVEPVSSDIRGGRTPGAWRKRQRYIEVDVVGETAGAQPVGHPRVDQELCAEPRPGGDVVFGAEVVGVVVQVCLGRCADPERSSRGVCDCTGSASPEEHDVPEAHGHPHGACHRQNDGQLPGPRKACVAHRPDVRSESGADADGRKPGERHGRDERLVRDQRGWGVGDEDLRPRRVWLRSECHQMVLVYGVPADLGERNVGVRGIGVWGQDQEDAGSLVIAAREIGEEESRAAVFMDWDPSTHAMRSDRE
ncbi:hypothetical protein C8Q74DRAFT_1219095 [Fomes fomentarius]|nr:hypothetical protein C8Q74DRAFT_1219095 [Fomes fomentarius]